MYRSKATKLMGRPRLVAANDGRPESFLIKRLRQVGDFDRACLVGQSPDESALFESRDQAMNPGLRCQFEFLAHFFVGRNNAIGLNPFVN